MNTIFPTDSYQELLEEAGKAFCCTPQSISSSSRRRESADARCLVSSVLYSLWGWRVSDIARIMHLNRSTVIFQIRKASDLYRRDPSFRRSADSVIEIL